MTTIDTSPEAVAASTGDADAASGTNPLHALAIWFVSTDHKLIGRLYLGGGALGLAAAVVVNILLAVERVDGANSALTVDSWAQLLDAQRVALVFGTMLPLGLGLAIAIVPLQLGSRALAFPRLAAAGFWLWLGGITLAVVALANDGGTSGGDGDMVDLFIAAHALLAIALAAGAGSIATTILTTRSPGMTMRRVPFFTWSALVYAIGLLLVMPVLLGTLTYLFLDHRNGRTGFGGNEGFTTWVGWIFTQPTTFLFAVLAVGVFVEILPVSFRLRTPARGVFFAGLALIASAAFAGVTQQNLFPLPWSGSGLSLDDFGEKVEDLIPYTIFNVLPIVGAALVLLLGLYLAAPRAGARPNLTPALVFSLFGFGLILVGMLGNALYAIDDLALQGTVFEEATLIYVVYGTVLCLMGGLTLWAPKLWGSTIPTGRVVPLAILGTIATILAAFPHYVAGFLDQPAGLAYDDSDLQVWNVLVLVGHGLMALTVLGFALLVAQATRRGDGAVDDPWDGQTIEWATTSPAPPENYVEVPIVHSAEPALDLRTDTEGSEA